MNKTISLLILVSVIMATLFLSGCGGKRMTLFPPVYLIHQEGQHLMICRVQADGTKICEYTMEFCKDDELICIPKKYWEKR